MAIGLKEEGAALAFKGGLLNGNRWIALFSAEGTELSGNGYARNPIVLADWQADGAVYENSGAETFGPPTPAAWLAITHWGLYDALTGGNLLLDVDITDTDPPGIGASVSAAAEAIGYSFSGVTTQGSIAALSEGLLSGTRRLTLHNAATPTKSNAINTDGSVGTTGTPVTVAATAGQWTTDTPSNTNHRARNNVILNYGIQTADLPDPQSVAIRNGTDHTAEILWSAALTADDPGLGDALQFAAQAIVIPLTIAPAA